MKTFVSRSVQW